MAVLYIPMEAGGTATILEVVVSVQNLSNAAVLADACVSVTELIPANASIASALTVEATDGRRVGGTYFQRTLTWVQDSVAPGGNLTAPSITRPGLDEQLYPRGHSTISIDAAKVGISRLGGMLPARGQLIQQDIVPSNADAGSVDMPLPRFSFSGDLAIAELQQGLEG